jgi:hypothetical protein
MKKIFLIICLLALLVPAYQLSAKGSSKSGHADSAVKKYVKQNVMPVLLQKRQILEAELTQEEQTTIAQYRTELKKLHAGHKQYKHGGATMADTTTHTASVGSKREKKEILLKLDVIAAKHNTTLAAIKTDLEPMRKQWNDDIQKLEPQGQNQPSKKERKYANATAMLTGKHHHSDARFLLLNVSKTTTGQ